MSTNGATPKILIEARKLLDRQPPGYSGSELRVFFDAAKEIPRDEPVSAIDSRILGAADRLASLFQERPPRPPTPFDDRISGAETAEAEAKATFEAAGEERWERAVDLGRLGDGSIILRGRHGPVTFWTGVSSQGSEIPNRRHVDKATVAAQASQEAYDLSESAFKKARVKKNELAQARGRWRAVAHLAVD